MGMIEKLYDGELYPCEQTGEYKKRIGDAHLKVCEAEEELLKAHPELYDAVNALANANIDLATETERSQYIKGFRQGALLMLDILNS